MKSKEDLLEEIANAGKEGITLTKLVGRKRKDMAVGKELLGELIELKKIVKKGSRFYLAGIKPTRKRKKKNYVTREELEGILEEVYKDIALLKDRIDRAFEYVDEVFLETRSRVRKKNLPEISDMQIAYDNVNRKENAGDSVPISSFKKELRRMGFEFDEDELNEKLLELDRKEIIYLQIANNPDELPNKEYGIQSDRGFLFYITWIKRS
ncbi:MAG: hypothetical protein J7L03_05240 [Caldisericaceae bacterium]|nr:hypothetical protein [Caldisericaceae bacterium]